VFKVLYDKLCELEKDFEVIIDISGFASEARAAAQNVAACFDSVTVVYARGEKDDEYDEAKYSPWIGEHSGPLITIPVPRIDVKPLQDKSSKYFMVFSAVYAASQQGKRKCTNKDVAEQMQGSKGQTPLTKGEKISVTMILRVLRTYGLIRMEYISAKAQEIAMTPFGIAKALFKKIG